MEKGGLTIGFLQSVQNEKMFQRQKRITVRKSSEGVKNRRKTLCAIRKNWSENNKEKEGKIYEAGGLLTSLFNLKMDIVKQAGCVMFLRILTLFEKVEILIFCGR